MKQVFSALMFAMVVAGTGCALTETVTPPPPKIGQLPPEAQALFARAVPQCRDPAKVKTSFPLQLQAIKREQNQVLELTEAEQNRWQRRLTYLERELNFYEKEVRRTGGSLEYTSAAPKPAAPVRVTTDSAFVDQIKRQREREYNEEQYRYFYRKLHRARAFHQKRINLYQERQEQLTQATEACGTLQVALRKAKEEEALQKNAKAVPPLPVLHSEEVPVEALPVDALAEESLPADALENSPSPLLDEAETMEQLLAQQPLDPEQAAPEVLAPALADESIALQPAAETTPVALDPAPPANAVALETAPDADTLALEAALQADPVALNPAPQTEAEAVALRPAPQAEAPALEPAPQAETVKLEPAPQAEAIALEPASLADPVAADAAPDSAPLLEEPLEELLRQPPAPPWNQVAQPHRPGRR